MLIIIHIQIYRQLKSCIKKIEINQVKGLLKIRFDFITKENAIHRQSINPRKVFIFSYVEGKSKEKSTDKKSHYTSIKQMKAA